MQDFDDFARRYLVQWDQRATVRGMARTRVPAGTGTPPRVHPSMFPVAQHPRVQALGPDAVASLLAKAATHWQAEVAHVEIAIVSDLCSRLSAGGYDFPLPAAARQVALTIATDEMYHAYAAREFMMDQAGAAAIEAEDGRRNPAIQQALDMIRRDGDPRFAAEAEIMALCFCENFVTEELLGFSRHDGNPTPFQIIAREHLMDEGRHQRYFTVLLTHIWATATDPCRQALATLLPGFLDTFLDNPASGQQRIVAALCELGLDAQTSHDIWQQTRSSPSVAKFARTTNAKTMQLIAAAGLDRDRWARVALTAGGWLPGQVAA